MIQVAHSLRDAYRFPGFVPARVVHLHLTDGLGWILELRRRSKRGSAAGVNAGNAGPTIAVGSWSGTWSVEAAEFT